MYIEGRNAILESLRSQREFKKLLVQNGINRDEKVRQILSKAKNRNIHIKYVSKKELDQISVTGVHQGFIGVAISYEEQNFDSFIDNLYKSNLEPFFVYIRDANYKHNVGAIIRTAECAGANAVILPPKINVDAEIIRASTGAAEHIKIFNESLFNAIKICKKNDIKVMGIEVNGTKWYYEQNLTQPIMMIVGGEDRSLSMEIQKKCDIIVKIPLLGKINSLNMSVASGIVIYEKVRQNSTIK